MLNQGGLLLLIIGVLLILVGAGSLARYLLDYSVLSPYGKGYVWGNLLLVVIGLTLIYFYYRVRKSR